MTQCCYDIMNTLFTEPQSQRFWIKFVVGLVRKCHYFLVIDQGIRVISPQYSEARLVVGMNVNGAQGTC